MSMMHDKPPAKLVADSQHQLEGSLRYLEPQGDLKPANAAVGLVVDEDGRYLVQLRDIHPTIFFPNHWGCFGGAIEPGESSMECLSRELSEELNLNVAQFPVRHFTTFTFDFGFAGGAVIYRAFYEVQVNAAAVDDLTLHEGRSMELIPGPQLLALQVVPYDRFAIWMHYYRRELRTSAAHASQTSQSSQ